MEVGDLNKVWEVKALKRKPDQEEAKKMLDRIAKQVQPIMRKHKWRVKLLSEFCPTNPRLLGLNVGSGVHVKLRLRRPNRDSDFYPYDEVLDTMLHELCHNAHGPHNASFYKLWDELRKECEQLMENGISGSGQGFDLPGKRLGGFSQRPLSSLRQASLSAAQKRQRTASLLPTGPNRLGGDKSIMSALSPMQAAAMAAERRLRDEIWCASASGHPVEEEDCSEFPGTNPSTERYAAASSSTSKSTLSRSSTTMSLKRKVGSTSADASSGSHSTNFVDLTTMPGKRPCQSVPSAQETPKLNVVDQNINAHKDEQSVLLDWECQVCTLLNPHLAPLCRVCGTRKPVFASAKYKSWFCKFCTLENGIELDKCLVCGHWRHSHGAPVSARAPNLGT